LIERRRATCSRAMPSLGETSPSDQGPEPAYAAHRGTNPDTSEASRIAAVKQVKQRIFADGVAILLAGCTNQPQSLLASGSLGRGEESILVNNGRATVLGDAEFCALFRTQEETKAFGAGLHSLEARLEAELRDKGIDCPVSVLAHSAETLRRMPPHILGFELRATARVLWGDQQVLALIPAFRATDIPKWDAWRSVGNRMIEQLACAGPCTNEDSVYASRLLYRCLKMQLDLATMVLHFHGAYRPTYQRRAQELRRLEGNAALRDELPWLSELAFRVERATQCKLDPGLPSPYRGVFADVGPLEQRIQFAQEECLQVVRLVRPIWFWGAARLLEQEFEDDSDPLEIGLAVARKQHWQWRLRGWLRLALDARSSRKAHPWSSMARLGILGSPRFLSYAIAAALYFTWPDWAVGKNKNADDVAGRALRYFPFAPKPSARCCWSGAAKAVVNGWEQYLKLNWA
jgi:hypothetical protein